MEKSEPPSTDILIVTALREELNALTLHFNLNSPISFLTTSIPCYIDPSVVCDSGVGSYSVAILCLNAMGNTNAGIDVTNALRDLNPSYVFMFGIAGGIKDEVALADVIIPDNIFYIATGKHHSSGLETRPQILRTDPLLLQRLHAYDFQHSNGKEYKVKVGPLAVGEQVIANSDAIAELRRIHPKLIGIEMESYGVGLAVFKYRNASFVAIRGVSDHADEEKTDGYRDKALENAADFLAGFIKTGLLPRNHIQKNEIPKFIAIHHLSLYRRPSIIQSARSYLKTLQGHDVVEMPIDQVDLYQDGSLTDPQQAFQQQKEMLARLEGILRENPNCELGYFGLAHVPLVFHMGYEINRREVRVFGNDYDNANWFELHQDHEPPHIIVDGFPKDTIEETGDIILLMSVTASIVSKEPNEIVDHPLATIHIRAKNPHRGLIDNEVSLNGFTRTFREVLEKINVQFPNVQRVHLFFASQPTLAFRCGQQINRNMDPEIIVYNYSNRDQPKYRWALNLQTSEIIERK